MDEGMAGGKAIDVQVGAELDARRTGFPGDQTGGKTFGTELKDDFLNGSKHSRSFCGECRAGDATAGDCSAQMVARRARSCPN